MPVLRHSYSICLLIIGLFAAPSIAQEIGTRSLFDGKTLTGWKGNTDFWSVKDGVIVGETTDENPLKENTFLVWEGGEVADFELRLKFKITGSDDKANSGIQFRSTQKPDGHMVGYQADIDRAGKWCGSLYDEQGSRKLMCSRGHKVSFNEQGERVDDKVADAKETFEKVQIDGWNEYVIRAQGNHLTLSINGQVMSEVFDGQTAEAEKSGLLGLQIHSGPAMKVEFKDIRYQDLSGYKSIFDGKSLAGWKGDEKLWRVEDGAIVGETHPDTKLKLNQFLIWDEGEVENFDLKLKFRISGTKRANSGVQFRSYILDGHRLAGYQADIDRSGTYIGILFSERTGRGILGRRGTKMTIRGKKDRAVEKVNDPAELLKGIDLEGWNDMQINAVGNHFVVKINGHTTTEVIDEEEKAYLAKGLIGLQIHVGPPMKVEYKDMYLKNLTK